MRRLLAAALCSLSVFTGIGLAAAPAGAQEGAAPRPIVGGWLGWWSSDATVDRIIAQSAGTVPEVNTFWWFFAGSSKPLCTYSAFNGTCVTSTTPWTNSKLDGQRQRLQAAGIKVLASITDLDKGRAGQLSAYLADPARRQAYAAQIADWVVKAGVDGVDLDWENFAFNDGKQLTPAQRPRDTWAATKPRWVAFIKELSAQLRAKRLILSATVPGGWAPFLDDGSANPGTGYWVYAWDEIAPYVDRLRIMAYDYSWDVAGPIGPNDWATEVVRSAVEQVGTRYASRIWIGQPQYGRNWIRRNTSGGYLTSGSCPSNWVPDSGLVRTTVTPTQAYNLAAERGVTPTWDPEYGEWTFRYSRVTAGTVNGVARSCTALREVWFGDTKSALARAAIVPTYRIGGIAVWNLEDVRADFYPQLATYAVSIAPQPTAVTVQAPVRATHGAPVTVSVAGTSTAEVPAGASVSLLWSATMDGPRTRVASGRLDATGRAALTVAATKSGYWWASVAGSWARRAGTSVAAVGTQVRYAVSVAASDATPAVGQEVRISARVSPAVAGTAVQFQKRIRGEWTTIRSLAMSKGGGASARVTPQVRKTLEFRFVIAPSDGIIRTVSPVIRLAVGS